MAILLGDGIILFNNTIIKFSTRIHQFSGKWDILVL
jgi:hypothetical protein